MTNQESTPSAPRSDLRYVRVVLYVQLLCIVLLAVFSLADRGLLKLPEVIESLFYLRAFNIPLTMTWIACPAAMGAAVSRLSHRSEAFRLGVVLSDAALSLFQLWVMLPLVQ